MLDRLRFHTLRCAPEGDGGAAAEATFERAARAPYRVSATLEEADPVARRARVRLRLLDRSDVAYAEEAFAAQARGGPVSAEQGRAVDAAAGEWSVPVRWSVGATSFSLHLTLAADEQVDTDALSLPRPPPPPVVPDGVVQRLSVRAEGLYANMLSTYQRNADEDTSGVFMGNAKDITHGLAGSLRLGLDLRRPSVGTSGLVFGVELFAAGVVFPRGDEAPGVSTLLGAGVRLTPSNGAVQPWVSAGAGAALTGGLLRLASTRASGWTPTGPGALDRSGASLCPGGRTRGRPRRRGALRGRADDPGGPRADAAIPERALNARYALAGLRPGEHHEEDDQREHRDDQRDDAVRDHGHDDGDGGEHEREGEGHEHRDEARR